MNLHDEFDSFQFNTAVDASRASHLLADVRRSAQERAQWEHSRDQAVLDAARLLQELDKKLDVERMARTVADTEQAKFTIRWNKINLVVGIVGVLVGIAGVVVAIVALFK